jgi:hypothetical protein
MRVRFSPIGLGLHFAKRSNRLQTQIHINLAEQGVTAFLIILSIAFHLVELVIPV